MLFVSHLKKRHEDVPVAVPLQALHPESLLWLLWPHQSHGFISVSWSPCPACAVGCWVSWCEQVLECLLISKVCGRPQGSHQVSVKICGLVWPLPSLGTFPLNCFLLLKLGVWGYSSHSCSEGQKSVCDLIDQRSTAPSTWLMHNPIYTLRVHGLTEFACVSVFASSLWGVGLCDEFVSGAPFEWVTVAAGCWVLTLSALSHLRRMSSCCPNPVRWRIHQHDPWHDPWR